MFLKNRNISSKIKRSKVTDYAALMQEVLKSHKLIHIFKACLFKSVNRILKLLLWGNGWGAAGVQSWLELK